MYGLYGRCVNLTKFSRVMRDALRMKPVFGSVLVRVREKPQKTDRERNDMCQKYVTGTGAREGEKMMMM